jgi:short-subunit dehydrogenase
LVSLCELPRWFLCGACPLHVLPQFKQKSGHIMVTSSVAGKLGSPAASSYSATKHAMQGYVRALLETGRVRE